MLGLIQTIARHASGALGRESRLVNALRPTYERVLNALARAHGVPWEINGVTYRVDARGRHRLGRAYDPGAAEFLCERVRPGALCLNVGANVGAYVLQFAHWSRPSGQVIAFEPSPVARKMLEHHVRLNGLEGRVSIEPAAIGERSGETEFFDSGVDGRSRMGEPNPDLDPSAVARTVVPVETIDRYCSSRELRPDWIFIDIEGFEASALRGAKTTIRARGTEMGVLVEFHPALWAHADTSRETLEHLLRELGVRAVPLTGQRDPLGDYGIVHLAHV